MRWPWTPPERLEIEKLLWKGLLGELALRGEGHRESGAFLLSQRDSQKVQDILYFDDLDPDCLQGNIHFAASGFTALFSYCREHSLHVLADVHTHPKSWVAQSSIDRAHPMIAMPGHVGLIVPYLAQRKIRRDDVGVHVYLGKQGWRSHYGRAARKRIALR